MKSIDIVK